MVADTRHLISLVHERLMLYWFTMNNYTQCYKQITGTEMSTDLIQITITMLTSLYYYLLDIIEQIMYANQNAAAAGVIRKNCCLQIGRGHTRITLNVLLQDVMTYWLQLSIKDAITFLKCYRCYREEGKYITVHQVQVGI